MAVNLNLSKSNINRISPVLTETNTSFITVSPNPTGGQFTLTNLKFIAGNTYPLDIYNSTGSRVLQQTLSSQQTTVSLTGATGDYFVNVNTQDGLAVRKVTKTGSES